MIIGRSTEIKLLNKIYQDHQPVFLAIYGRRRVGKTFLIDEFFRGKGLFFSITGVKNAPVATQLKNFSFEYAEIFLKGKLITPPKNWMDALRQLWDQIKKGNERIILFFDELPWLASRKSGFLEALDYFWNKYFSKKNNLIVIICGSAASWMIKKVVSDKGGLHGRLTHQIRLHPFNLLETREFFESKGIYFEPRQIVDFYMAIGGIPKYLNYVEKGLSPIQNIQKICFAREGPLVTEFNKLYGSLFEGYQRHVRLVKELSQAPYGLGYRELLKRAGFQSGGTASSLLEELIESDFIIRVPIFGKGVKDSIYQLMDEYSLFYLCWINRAPLSSLKGVSDNYWIKKHQTPSFKSWSGFAFERLCMKHLHKILGTLGILGVNTSESSWLYQSNQVKDPGCQIDLVIDRDDHCINLCEIKFHNHEIALTRLQANILEKKKRIFQEKTGTKKTLFTTLITTYGLKENAYASYVDQVVTLKDLF